MPEPTLVTCRDELELLVEFNDRTEFRGFKLKNPLAIFEVGVDIRDYKHGPDVPLEVIFYPTGKLTGTEEPSIVLQCMSYVRMQDLIEGRTFDLQSFLGRRDDVLAAALDQVLLTEAKLEVINGVDTPHPVLRIILGEDVYETLAGHISSDVWEHHFVRDLSTVIPEPQFEG